MAGKGGVSDRFGGVGAWRVRSNFPVFLRSRDRGSGDAVVFRELAAVDILTKRGRAPPAVVVTRFAELADCLRRVGALHNFQPQTR